MFTATGDAKTNWRKPLCGLLAVALTGLAQPSPAQVRDREAIVIRSVSHSGDLLTFVADRDDLLRRFGKPVIVDYARRGSENIVALRAGEVDFALMPMTPYVLDLLADPTPGEADDPVILANLSHGVPSNRVAALSRAPMADPGILDGARVGLELGTEAEFFWSMFAIHNRLDTAAIRILDMPAEDLGQALLDGQVDAVVTDEARLRDLEPPEGRYLTLFADDMMQTERWLLVTRRDVLAALSFSAGAVVRAYARAVERVQRDPDAAIRDYALHWGASPEEQKTLRRRTIYDLTLDWGTYSGFRQKVTWAERSGYPAARRGTDFTAAIAPATLVSILPNSVMPAHLAGTPTGPGRK